VGQVSVLAGLRNRDSRARQAGRVWIESESTMDTRGIVTALFEVPRALIGTIHVGALPGTPGNKKSVAAIAEDASREARVYETAGFHGLAIENTHDRPYLKGSVGPEIGAAMAVIGSEVRRVSSLPLGVQVLAGANLWALAVAHACGAAFVRVEGFVFAHVADEGLIESSAGALLRYRRTIGAENVKIFADIKKKHSAHAITADVDIVETAKAAEFFQANGVIVSGVSTGEPADACEVRAVSEAVSIPTLIGSGITPENIGEYAAASAFIVGSSVKEDGNWENALEETRVRALVRALEKIGR
jgi:membrane complex biogenesis BtpA family protein